MYSEGSNYKMRPLKYCLGSFYLINQLEFLIFKYFNFLKVLLSQMSKLFRNKPVIKLLNRSLEKLLKAINQSL